MLRIVLSAVLVGVALAAHPPAPYHPAPYHPAPAPYHPAPAPYHPPAPGMRFNLISLLHTQIPRLITLFLSTLVRVALSMKVPKYLVPKLRELSSGVQCPDWNQPLAEACTL